MRNSGGFTLVEVLVALFIFTVGIIGVMALFYGAARTGQMAKEETESALVGSSVIADLRSQLEGGAKLADQPERPHRDFHKYKYTVSVIALDEESREFYVEVLVRWQARGGRGREQKFSTIILRKQ